MSTLPGFCCLVGFDYGKASSDPRLGNSKRWTSPNGKFERDQRNRISDSAWLAGHELTLKKNCSVVVDDHLCSFAGMSRCLVSNGARETLH